MGIAALSTMLTQREQFHSNRIGEAVSLYNPQTRQQIDQLTQILINRGTEASVASNQAITQIANTVRREAYIQAYNDCFYLIGFALLLTGLMLLFVRKVKAGNAAAH